MTKHFGKFVAYYRVSTGKQGLGIEAQKTAVQNYLDGGRWTLIAEFTEKESGRKKNRSRLKLALAECRLKNAALVVAKLDRLARDAEFLRTIVRESGERGVVFCDMPNIPQGPQGKFLVGIMAEVAELEAGLISERTRAALAVKAAELAKVGKRLGTPCPDMIKAHAPDGGKASARVRKEAARKRAADLAPVVEEIRARGVSTLLGIAHELNAQGHTAPRGGQWSHVQVMHLLKNI
jgi:DNA invertase Pin-like site-specific DNA recombinase